MGFFAYLKELESNGKNKELFELMFKLFANRFNDENFMKWICDKIA